MGGRPQGCLWCGVRGGDSLNHYIVCTSMLEALKALMPELAQLWSTCIGPPCLPELSLKALGFSDEGENLHVQLVIWHDLMHNAYTSARNGNFKGSKWKDLFSARRRVYARFAPAVHERLIRR